MGITAQTDKTGKLIIRTMAEGLHTPALILQIAAGSGEPGDAQPVGIAPSGHVYNFLAGTEQLPVGGGESTSFTASTLQQFQPAINAQTAQDLVQNIAKISKLPNGASAARLAGFAIRRDSNGPRLLSFHTSKDLTEYQDQQRITAIVAGLPQFSISGVLDDIKHAAEDVVHGIEHGVTDVENFVVDTASGVVSFTLKVANGIETAFKFVVRTIKDAALAIEAVMVTLVADIEAIIKWLMLLLDWEKIIETQKKIVGLVESLIETSQTQLSGVAETVQQRFAELSQNFQQQMEYVIQQVSGKTISDLPNNWPTMAASKAPLAHSSRATLLAAAPPLPSGLSLSQLTWLLDKVLKYAPSIGFGSLGSFDPASILSALHPDNVVSELGAAFESVWSGLVSIFKDPGQVGTIALSTFLTTVQDLVLAVLDLLEDLVLAFITWIQGILGGVNRIFNHSPDIPFIGPLYKLITGEDLTLLNAATLVIAAPLYIVHRLLFGSNPFSGLDTASRQQQSQAPQDDLAKLWKEAYAACGVINVVFTGVHDLENCLSPEDQKKAPVAMTSFLVDTLALLMQVCCWPSSKGFPFIDAGAASDSVEDCSWLNWAAFGTLPLWDYASLVSVEEMSSFEPVFASVMGAGALAFGAIAGGIGYAKNPQEVNAYGLSEFLVGPWSALLQFTMFSDIRSAITDSTAVDPAWVMTAIDAAINVAVPVLN